MAFLCDALRTAQIEIDSVTILFYQLRRCGQSARIIGAELDDEGPILWTRGEVVPAGTSHL